MSEHHNPAVTHFAARHGEFEPQKGGFLTVDLGEEKTRAEILNVVSRDVVTARISGPVLDKSGHGYRKDGVIAVRRDRDRMGIETWVPVSLRAVTEAEEAAALAEREADRLRPKPEEEMEEPASVELVTATEPEPSAPERRFLGARRSRVVAKEPVASTRKFLGARRSKVAR